MEGRSTDGLPAGTRANRRSFSSRSISSADSPGVDHDNINLFAPTLTYRSLPIALEYISTLDSLSPTRHTMDESNDSTIEGVTEVLEGTPLGATNQDDSSSVEMQTNKDIDDAVVPQAEPTRNREGATVNKQHSSGLSAVGATGDMEEDNSSTSTDSNGSNVQAENPHSQQWDDNYETLVQYLKYYEQWPGKYAPPWLYRWAYRQRDRKRVGLLRPDQSKRLDNIGYPWTGPIKGVPYHPPREVTDGDGADMEYYDVESVPSHSTPAYRQERDWTKGYLRLAKFVKMYDTWPTSVRNPKLVLWMYMQQEDWREGRMSENHFYLLMALGYDFNRIVKLPSRSNSRKVYSDDPHQYDFLINNKAEPYPTTLEEDRQTWEETFSRLLRYLYIHGQWPTPSTDRKLCEWVEEQRENRSESLLGREEDKKLNRTGFPWEGDFYGMEFNPPPQPSAVFDGEMCVDGVWRRIDAEGNLLPENSDNNDDSSGKTQEPSMATVARTDKEEEEGTKNNDTSSLPLQGRLGMGSVPVPEDQVGNSVLHRSSTIGGSVGLREREESKDQYGGGYATMPTQYPERTPSNVARLPSYKSDESESDESDNLIYGRRYYRNLKKRLEASRREFWQRKSKRPKKDANQKKDDKEEEDQRKPAAR